MANGINDMFMGPGSTWAQREQNIERYGYENPTAMGYGSMKIAADYERYSRITSGIGAFTNLLATVTEYGETRFDATQKKLQATQVGIQAEERANLLRSKVIEDVSNSMASYAARGVSISSGTPISMAEQSLKAGGEDVQTIRRDAAQKKSALRAEAKMLSTKAKVGLFSGLGQSVIQGVSAFQGGF